MHMVAKLVQFFGQDKTRSFGMTLDATINSGLFVKKVTVTPPCVR